MRTKLNCELGDERREIVLHLTWDDRPPSEHNRTGCCRVRFEHGSCRLEAGFDIDRDIVRSFLSELQRMYDELDGIATLCSWGSTSELVLKVLDRGRGIIGVGVSVAQTLPAGRDSPERTECPFGPEATMSVGGLTTDQSFLPPFLKDVRSFLVEADADLDQAEHQPGGSPEDGRQSYVRVFAAPDHPVPKMFRLFMEAVQRHGVPLGRRCLLFSTFYHLAAALDASADAPGYSTKRGITFAETTTDWAELPDLLGLLVSRRPRGRTGLVVGEGEFGPAAVAEVGEIMRREHWLRKLFEELRDDGTQDAVQLRRLAAVGQASLLVHPDGVLIEVALHPPDERMTQRLVTAACDLGLHAESWPP